MSDGIIPDDVRQFLLKSIDSIAQWEGLLWLRANAGQAWDAGAVARHLYIADAEAAFLMDRLVMRGMVTMESPGRLYRYRPAAAELDALIGRAADLYRRYLIPVTQIIHSKPPSRVQEFANAFRIRKDPPQ
ncbi:MAG: hypothetical protein ACXU8U_11820 [Asticcacaulis sp.]